MSISWAWGFAGMGVGTMALDRNEVEIDPISCGCAIIMLGLVAVPFVIAVRIVWAMIYWAWNVRL